MAWKKLLVVATTGQQTETGPERVQAFAGGAELDRRAGGDFPLRQAAPGRLIALQALCQPGEQRVGRACAVASKPLEDALEPVPRLLLPLNCIPVFHRRFVNETTTQDRGIVDQDVELPKVLDAGVNDAGRASRDYLDAVARVFLAIVPILLLTRLSEAGSVRTRPVAVVNQSWMNGGFRRSHSAQE